MLGQSETYQSNCQGRNSEVFLEKGIKSVLSAFSLRTSWAMNLLISSKANNTLSRADDSSSLSNVMRKCVYSAYRWHCTPIAQLNNRVLSTPPCGTPIFQCIIDENEDPASILKLRPAMYDIIQCLSQDANR